MKARLLKKILNDTGYAITNHEPYIAIGSPYVHNLISVDKKTFEVKYALDTFREGRKAIKNPELEFIWDKLHELNENGQMKDIVEGQDEIENPVTIYTIDDGKLIETFTDKFGFPNITVNGDRMYTNTHFKTKEEAIENGIKDYKDDIENWTDGRLKELEEKVEEVKNRIAQYKKYVDYLEKLSNV